ncbi:ArsO family NAD(P)H-dependent flavin-containing monooxygenase [Sphingobacterium sp. UT-1RO-CII-1]|uniref:ArsO family NAD(P)H-dependent flavin-containing monooxygenase n=1 Tax=Sphingobacterium sp. UT-1RO-CII-1 TaxID=2995225 RepID=UPI00227C6BCD|nr:ArsO family NAD(P)H-dependent flavin-containing monooxygenase [Sphingobacterium sp. UT-1RO-CII-1]MCY4781654.1 ArsO family NAD(P)H-dependent flavin-containing monooxygenase [Sphingobacterium sp. UT-1RO-CII-1]
MKIYDVIIIGGGQSALACGYFLRRTQLNYIILDDQEKPGGAWNHGWDSLTLFSPAQFSSLPGWFMPESIGKFPSRKETIRYLSDYETKYNIPVLRATKVNSVKQTDSGFQIETTKGTYSAKAVISATGNWSAPFIPPTKGRESFKGLQMHSAHYKTPDIFEGQKVLVVGAGNSGAQLLAEISTVAHTEWSTLGPPIFLPDHVDGRVLFDTATAMYNAQKEGRPIDKPQYDLSNIVMVPSVVDARQRDVLQSKGKVAEITPDGVIWESGEQENFDAIVWCTGFKPATQHLESLNITDAEGKINVSGTKSNNIPGLWLVGYGHWTGFASATLIGVGRSARATIIEVEEYIKNY